MSFKSEAAKVRAGISSGSYKKKTDPYAGFFDELTYGLKKRDEEKRQEEIEKRREARAEERQIKAKQAAEDKAEQERQKLANLYLTANAQSKTPQNKAAVMAMITDGGITNLADLETMMSSYTTYNQTTQGDIDAQMDAVGLLQEGDGPFNAMREQAEGMSTSDGTISFTGKKEQDVLSMPLDQVRFELSDTSISTERRELLERRLKSLIDPATYESTELYHPDGSKVTARTAEEEATYLSQGFSQVEGPEATDYEARVLYKDGGEVKVFSKAQQSDYEALGYSAEKPAAATPFVKRTLFKDGAERVVNTQDEMDVAVSEGFIATKAAPEAEYETKTFYRDGDEIKVNSLEEQQSAVADGFGPIKFGDVSQIMKDLGVDRKTAAQIDNGTLKLTANTRGELTIVNNYEATSTTVQQQPVDDLDKVPPTMEEAIAQAIGVDPDANPNWEKQETVFNIPAYKNEDGEVIEAQTVIVSPAMIQEYKQSEGASEDIGDIRSAFGLKGRLSQLAGQAGGLIGKDWQPETNAAISYLENLRLNTLITLAGTAANGLRDSVWNKQQILTTLAEPAKVWKGAASQQRKLKLTAAEIAAGIKVAETTINSQYSSPSTISKAKVTLAGLRSLENKYKNVLSLFDQSVAADKPITDTVLKKPAQEKSIPEPEIGIVGALPTLTPELVTAVLAGIKNGNYSAQAARNSFYKKFSKESVDRLIPLN